MASNNIDLYVDETYLLSLINDEPLPISDEKYAHELSLQEAIYSSTSTLASIYTESNYTKIYNFPKTVKKEKIELGESSNKLDSKEGSNIFCGICMESKNPIEIFNGLSQCNSHPFCMDCITKYVTSKVKENIAIVECPFPKCKNKIEVENCYDILPKEVFCRWENALCEALILGSEKFYCPYKECSALMVHDTLEEVVQAECPNCRKLFCARCHVKWHVGFTCDEFIKLKEDERGVDDLMVMNLAKDKKWKRCSNCNFYVEKTEGCLHMTCRCQYQFCYQCGNKWGSSHAC